MRALLVVFTPPGADHRSDVGEVGVPPGFAREIPIADGECSLQQWCADAGVSDYYSIPERHRPCEIVGCDKRGKAHLLIIESPHAWRKRVLQEAA